MVVVGGHEARVSCLQRGQISTPSARVRPQVSVTLSVSPQSSSRPCCGRLTPGHRLHFADFLNHVCSLAASLRWLSKGSVAIVLAPNSLQVVIVYFAQYLSIGIVVSPAGPFSRPADISRQVHLSRPDFFYATPDTAHKLPSEPLGPPPQCWPSLLSSHRHLFISRRPVL